MALNKILERAVNLKHFLKGKERIQKVAKFAADHYRENAEPLGYKAFLVGVDREACAHYKHALDQFLPAEYSEVVYTGSNNDSALLKEFHLDPKKERQIRKSFGKLWKMLMRAHLGDWGTTEEKLKVQPRNSGSRQGQAFSPRLLPS